MGLEQVELDLMRGWLAAVAAGRFQQNHRNEQATDAAPVNPLVGASRSLGLKKRKVSMGDAVWPSSPAQPSLACLQSVTPPGAECS